MKTFEVEVKQYVRVTVDETKFTDEFMKEFSSYMFHTDSLEDHVKYLAQLCAREMIDDFIEGYGPPKKFGIKCGVFDGDEEIIGEVK
ncbi:MAG: hypothetical protein P4L79_10270 [Legionella sp.]|uniref:hypothetical protein n=1 Tax=Legionella sp. TaxID=459 RepID=UPI002844E2EC|nr:hypothetical protein [Legionella sp.]